MPFEIIRHDITRMPVDAIVNAANHTLLGGGGVDGAIHRAAGPGLRAECRGLGGCEPGEAKVTGAYQLPCRYVIHTVGPIWQGGDMGEEQKLADCYRHSLAWAEKLHCESVAFPLISAGAYGYPREKALAVAVGAIREFLQDHEMMIYLVIFDRASFEISEKRAAPIRQFIDDHYLPPTFGTAQQGWKEQGWKPFEDEAYDWQDTGAFPLPTVGEKPPAAAPAPKAAEKKPSLLGKLKKKKKQEAPLLEDADAGFGQAAHGAGPQGAIDWDFPQLDGGPEANLVSAQKDGDLEAFLRQLDEGFRDMLLRKIDESGMTDAECYKKANIDRKLFNKIKNQPGYRPGKPTVLAFAIALRLPLEETRDMLGKAGFSLSHSSKFDLIIEYFIRQGNYNIFEINEALFAFDQALLGASA